jgi:two-component system phosphate regulon sensor histidine kinase PhoR
VVQDQDIFAEAPGAIPAPAQRRPPALAELGRRITLVAGIAVLAILGASIFAEAELPYVIFAAALVGVAGMLIYFNAKPEIEAEAARALAVPPPAPPAPDFDLVLRQLLGALPDAAFIVDREGRMDWANSRARNSLSLPQAGHRLAASLRDPRLLEAILEVAAGGEPQSVPFNSAGPLEEYFRAQIAGFEILGKRYALVVVHDETAAKKVERMRVDFLANASHELRTPLAAVVGSIETLTGHARNDPAGQERFLGIMQVQADRMRRLIDDLLSLSKIELNEHVPPHGEADLEKVVRETVDTLSPISGRKKVNVIVKRAGGSAVVSGNRDELVQVAQNLIDNAIKYAPVGGTVEIEIGGDVPRDQLGAIARRNSEAAHVSLAAPRADADRVFGYIRVSDNGPGMPRASLPRLSERFFRVEEAKNSDRVGTGLGLAIVKHITNRHRGGLFVESQIGQGSSFTVCAPNLK